MSIPVTSSPPIAKHEDVGSGPKGPGLTPIARVYIVGVCLIALFVLILQPILPVADPAGLAVFFVLGGVAQFLPIRFHKNASISMSMAIAMAAILVLGPAYAVWVNISSGLVHYFSHVRPKKQPFYRSAVTSSTLVIAVWTASQVYVASGGQVGAGSVAYSSLPPLVIAGLIYYMVNSVMVTKAMALEQRTGFWALFQLNYKWLTVNVASLTLLGFGIALVYQKIGLFGLALFMMPIVLAWYSFQLYARTTEDVRKANDDLKEAHEGVSRTNEELKQASERISKTNEELIKSNERLNVMYEVSRTLAGSLHLEEYLKGVLEAARLLRYSASFVAGPLSANEDRIQYWQTEDSAYAGWSFAENEGAGRSGLYQTVIDASRESWFRRGEARVLGIAELEDAKSSALTLESGSARLPFLTLLPLSARGEPWGIVGVGSDSHPSPMEIKELSIFQSMANSALGVALAHEKAQRDAMVDNMTGLYNHRFFQDALQRELQEATRRNGLFSLLMLDINKFKEFNDLYGHLVGDQVIQAVAQILRENVREEDVVCRYGGDEFCVLLPHADRARAIEVASRIDRAVRNYQFQARREGGTVNGPVATGNLSVSIGVAAFPESAHTRAGLIEKADRACYLAKGMGGGVVSDPGSSAANEDANPKGHSIRLQLVK